jgi:hypothetical protein
MSKAAFDTKNFMTNKIKLGKYRHFKNKDKEYEVLGVARHTETGESLVVYKKLYDDYSLFVRPYNMFIEEMEVGNKKVPRFEYLGE